ncbi:uncharacterized protein BDW43DRAFT_274699 [Aspergillus alliaceus]|uniref:uncharacterized protein n=1 Tax=Petromyces alliaceus TaxID=209559 RepID=UPI0012A7120E|nr:uncharacterized protein BDW43DRAFT_274699 [Aspergillus alliaceus]KAB8233956.1 hypothetical protein BDW43DRAFT_274699 [Aspergillus alliaceus]
MAGSSTMRMMPTLEPSEPMRLDLSLEQYNEDRLVSTCRDSVPAVDHRMHLIGRYSI